MRNDRVYRGAETHSDHYLVKAEIRVNLKQGGRRMKRKNHQDLMLKSLRNLKLSRDISWNSEIGLRDSRTMKKMKKPHGQGSRVW